MVEHVLHKHIIVGCHDRTFHALQRCKDSSNFEIKLSEYALGRPLVRLLDERTRSDSDHIAFPALTQHAHCLCLVLVPRVSLP